MINDFLVSGILDTALSDESTHQIHNLVESSGVDGDSDLNGVKQEVDGMTLGGVTAQIACFGDANLSHTIPGLHSQVNQVTNTVLYY